MVKFLLSSGFEDITSIDSNNVVFKRNGKYGIMSTDGTVLVEPTYDELTFAFSNNYIAKNGENYGIIKYIKRNKIRLYL